MYCRNTNTATDPVLSALFAALAIAVPFCALWSALQFG